MSRFSYYPPILGYHCVGPFRDDHVPTVSAEAFERQLAFIRRRRYRIVPVETFAACLLERRPFPRRSLAITFDDGYEETASVAWPLLKRFEMPATVFITPMEIGRPGFLTWAQVEELAREGMDIGSHTMSHSYLPLVADDQLAQELVSSKHTIEEHLGRPVRVLSYPVGGFTQQVQALAKQAGYEAACTTNRVSTPNGRDPFALRRIKVTEIDANPWAFWAKLSGYYDAFRQLKAPS